MKLPPTKSRLLITVLVGIFGFLFFLTPETLASTASDWIGGIASSGLSAAISWALYAAFAFIGQATTLAMNLFKYLVFIRIDNGMPVVKATWTILRDFSNMLFILGLVWMAFATIFDLSATFSKTIVRFVMVAVLINFSLAIGGLVIDGCQVMTNVFLSTIGDPAAKIGTYLNPSLLLNADPNSVATFVKGADGLGAAAISLFFSVAISLFFLFGILVADVFSIIRIFMVWALLIVSPMAWMANILPGTTKWFKQWWGLFLGWNLFMPVYLFFLYLGLFFLSQRDAIVNATLSNTSGGDKLIGAVSNSLSFNVLFFYIFASVVIGGGAWAAKALTSKWSFGSTNFADWGYNRAKSFVKRVPIPGIGSLQANEYAINQRAKQFQQQGFQNRFLNKIYGGEDASEREKQRIAARFGVDGALEKEVGNWKKRMESLSPRELELQMNSGSKAQKLAARELLRGMDRLGKDDLIATYKMYGGDESPLAKKFLTDVDFGKLNKGERYSILNDSTIKDTKVRQKLAKTMAEKGDVKEATELANLATSLFGSNEVGKRDFIDAAKKKRINVSTRAMASLNLTGPRKDPTTKEEIPGTHLNGDEFLEDQINKMSYKDLVDQETDVWKDDQFKKLLLARIQTAQNNDKRKRGKGNNVTPGGGQNIIRTLKGLAKDNNAKLEVITDLESNLELGPVEENKDKETGFGLPVAGAGTTGEEAEDGNEGDEGADAVSPAGGGGAAGGPQARTSRGSGNYGRGAVGFTRNGEAVSSKAEVSNANVLDLSNKGKDYHVE